VISKERVQKGQPEALKLEQMDCEAGGRDPKNQTKTKNKKEPIKRNQKVSGTAGCEDSIQGRKEGKAF